MKKLPVGVVMLGFVSLFMDMSSEMAHSILPLFVVGTLGASAAILGLLEALAALVAQFAKLYSGLLSDRMQSRKGLALLGYAMAALSKPFFPLATAPWMVFIPRISDRIGKGIRGAPRDAMVADMSAADQRGAAFGLRQAMDSFGAFAGPLTAVALIGLYAFDVRAILWVACIPALICVAILAFGVSEPPRQATAKKPSASFSFETAKALGPRFWLAAMIAMGIYLARISDAFLVLRASQLGLGLVFIPLVLVVYNGVDTLASYPSGAFSDRYGRKLPLALGLVALAISMALLGFSSSISVLWLSLIFYGLHMALSSSVLSGMIADSAPPELRASAFGAFSFVTGIATFAGALAVGVVWDAVGAQIVFIAAAVVALAALVLLTLRSS